MNERQFEVLIATIAEQSHYSRLACEKLDAIQESLVILNKAVNDKEPSE